MLPFKRHHTKGHFRSIEVLALVALAISAPGCAGDAGTVGKVTRIIEKKVLVGNAEVTNGAGLFAKSLLVTNALGSVAFELDSGTACQTRPRSGVQIEPGENIRLRFTNGKSFCSKKSGGKRDTYEVGDTLIVADDPVFAVEIDPKETVVQTTFGFVEVMTGAGSQPIIIGPDQQAVVSSVQQAPHVEPIELSQKETRIASALEAQVSTEPKPPSNLNEVAERGVLVIGADASMPGPVRAFVMKFAELLGAKWSVTTRVEFLRTGEARKRLDDGTEDIAVAPAQARLSSSTVPLFKRRSTTWLAAISPNDDFEESLRKLITVTTETGEYGALYNDTFKSQPTYTRTRGAVLPDSTQPAVTPTVLDFGEVDVGQEATRSVTLSAGSQDLAVSDVMSSSAEFALTKTCPNTLVRGNSCTIGVTFVPISTGGRSARLLVSVIGVPQLAVSLTGTGINATGPTLAPAVVDFGRVDLGKNKGRSLTLTAGSEDLTISDVRSDSSEFVATRKCPDTLANADHCTIKVTFTPTSSGTKSGTLTIEIPPDQSRRAQLNGVGVVPPTTKPRGVDFGSVVVGQLRRRTILLKAGSEPLMILKLQTVKSRDFAASSDCLGAQITPGTNCTVTIEFKPLSRLRQRALLRISFSDHAAIRVALTGTGIQGLVKLQPTSLDFGVVSHGSPSPPKSVTLTNAGSAPLRITKIDSRNDAFSVDSACPPALAVGERCTFWVVFAPTGEGVQSASVRIAADGGGQRVLPVTGVGSAS
jgi:hypothetical protein